MNDTDKVIQFEQQAVIIHDLLSHMEPLLDVLYAI